MSIMGNLPRRLATTEVPVNRRLHLDRRAAALRNAEAAKGPPDQLITTPVLCEWLGVSLQWAEIARLKGTGPPFKKLGHSRVRYKRSDVLAWLEERTYLRTADYPDYTGGTSR